PASRCARWRCSSPCSRARWRIRWWRWARGRESRSSTAATAGGASTGAGRTGAASEGSRLRKRLAAGVLRARQPDAIAPVGAVQVELRPERHDAGGIDRAVALVVVALDVLEVDGVGDAGNLVELAQVARQVREVGDAPAIALEVAVVDRIEAHQRREQAPVRLGDAIADQVALSGEPSIELVERCEQLLEGLRVGGLGR